MQRLLFIGAGGTGGKTVRYLWRELDRRLRAHGWGEGIPAGWQFLHIDVAQNVDVIEGDVPAQIGQDAQYLGLAEQGRSYADYDARLVNRPELRRALAGWRPDPRAEYAPPYKGAGQRRVVGRVVTLTELPRVERAITQAVTTMSSPDVDNELTRLGERLGFQPAGDGVRGRAYVISSLSGGSGSGIFVDLLELVRAQAKDPSTAWLEEAVSVLYMADVFTSLPKTKRDGVGSNALGALSELLGSFYHQGGLTTDEQPLAQLGSGIGELTGRRAPVTNFFVGSGTDQGIKLESNLDVYRSVAKALTAFHLIPNVQAQYETYTGVNLTKGAPNTGLAFIEGGAAPKPATSLGFASVTLGRALFTDYAAQRLARGVIDTLLEGHRREIELARQRDDGSMAAEVAENTWADFLEQAGLRRPGEQRTRFLDNIRDKEELGAMLTQALASARQQFSQDARTDMRPSAWLQAVQEYLTPAGTTFRERAWAAVSTKTAEWATSFEQGVLDAAAWSAGTYGLLVAAKHIDLLSAELQAIADELQKTSAGYMREGDEAAQGETSALGREDRVLNRDHDGFGRIFDLRRKRLQRALEADVRLLVADVVRDARSSILVPLRASLENGLASLQLAVTNDPGKSILAQWSTGAVPAYLRPAPNEILIQDEDEFPAELTRQLLQLFATDAEGSAEVHAIEEIVSGDYERVAETRAGARLDASLVTRIDKWVPQRREARSAADAASARTPKYRVELNPQIVLDRAEAWVEGRDGNLQRFVTAQLADWLGDEGAPDRDSRASTFAAALQTALKSAAPLVSVNQKAHDRIHGEIPPHEVVMSPIPIDPAQPRHRATLDVLVNVAGKSPEGAAGATNPQVQGESVEIASFLGHTVHPVALNGVYEPILKDWRERYDEDSRIRFWQFARARSLPAAVGISPQRLRVFLRGWYTAWMLGHVGVLTRPWSEEPLTVWTRRGERPFPVQLLTNSQVRKHADVLPAICESLPLAFAHLASGQAAEYEAYERVLRLGEPPEGIDHDYTALNAELAQWIDTGTLIDPEPDFPPARLPDARISGDPAGTPEERRSACARAIESHIASFEQLSDTELTLETTLSLRGAWELREPALHALRQLHEEVLEHINEPAREVIPGGGS